jgi:transposase-like protein
MVSIHHANAKTTVRVRKEIQESQETIAQLAERLSVNPKTILYWKHAGRVDDAKSGPKNPRSTVLSAAEEQIICEFRRLTKFSLDDVFVSLKDKIPALTRSNLHRCLKRHGLSRLPPEENAGAKPSKKKFKAYEIGYVHIDITEIRLGKQKAYMFVGICRVSKYAYVELHDRMTVTVAVRFLENLIADFPFKIHTILTDNGAQFTYALLATHLKPKTKIHLFDAACERHGIRHKLTKFKHPWTNGQVEAMNKTIKAHTTKTYHYDTAESLKKHLMAFVMLHNFQKKLKALNFKSPYDTIIEIWKIKPELFRTNPHQKILGLNI